MKVASLFLAIIFVGALVGCETTHEERTALTGSLIGAAAGGIIGHQSGKPIEKYVVCPKCGTTLQLPATATTGNKVKCGRCGTSFILR